MDDVERSRAELEHDLGEPLRTVAGLLELLRRRLGERLDHDEHELLRQALTGVTRLQALVEARRDGAARADLSAVVAGALDGLDALVRERGARVDVEPLPTVPGDGAALGRLFQNLLANAIRYTEPGVAPCVRVFALREGARWAVVIADNGVGLTDVSGRRGLGLAVALRVVSDHGGELAARPGADGTGTDVVVTLPAG